MHHNTWRIAALLTLAGGLAACGGGNNNSAPPPTPPPVTPPPAAALEDQFGTGFGMSFRAMVNADATDPAAGAIIPLSLTTDAVTL